MGPQSFVAVSSPGSSSATSGPSAAAPPVLVVKAPPAVLGAAAKGLGSLFGRIAGSKPVQAGGKLLEDMSSAFSQSMAGQTAGGAGAAEATKTGSGIQGRAKANNVAQTSDFYDKPPPHMTPAQQYHTQQSGEGEITPQPEMPKNTIDEIADDKKMVEDAAKEGAKAVLKPSAMVGVGYMGYGGMKNRAQKKEQETTAEQERIQQIGEQARSKAGTGGGQVAVTA